LIRCSEALELEAENSRFLTDYDIKKNKEEAEANKRRNEIIHQKLTEF
jgi:hypothetical protein